MSIDVLDRLRAADPAAGMREPDEDDRERLRRAIVATPLPPKPAPWWRRLRGRSLVALVAGAVLLGGGTVYAGVYVADVLIGPQPDQVVWQFKTGGPVRSSVTVAEGVVYVGSDDGNLYALDSRSGQPRWTFKTGGPVHSSAAAAGEMVYCRSDDGYLYALDSRDGQQRWRSKVGGPAASPPAISGGMVYVATSTGQGRGDVYLQALDGRSGRERWKTVTGGGLNFTSPAASGGVVYSPAASGGVVYFGITAFDGKTGQKKWTFKAYHRPAYPNPTPVISHGLVYFGVEGWIGGMRAADAQSGREEWSFDAGWTSAAVSGGVVYCNGAGSSAMSHSNRPVFRLHALDARSGEELWASDGSDEGSVAASGDLVCFTDERTLYAVDAGTGHDLWQYETGGPIGSAPAISDGVVYVGSDDGYLYAVK